MSTLGRVAWRVALGVVTVAGLPTLALAQGAGASNASFSLPGVSPVALAIIGIGLLCVLVSSIMILVAAFRAHVLWGLGCLFLPIVPLVFVLVYIKTTWKALLLQIMGYAIMVIAVVRCAAQIGMNLMALAPQFTAGGAGWPEVGGSPETEQVELVTGTGAEFNADIAASGVRVGDTVADVIERLGPPRGRLESKEGVVLLYPEFTVHAADGQRVSAIQDVGETEIKPASPPSKKRRDRG